MNRRHFLAASVALAGLARPALVRPAWAQSDWPSRGVTIVVPFTPGGSSDIIARAMAQHMQQALGQPVVVENKPGAGGEIGARGVIRSAPDGYTLMHAPISTWAINVPLRPRLGYDPVTQLTRIMQTVRTPNVLVINQQKLPANDLPGVIAWLKRNGGNAAYSTSGIGSSDHLTMEMFKQVTGTDIAHVPYNGGSPATTALLSGDVQLSFQNLGSITPQIQSGRRCCRMCRRPPKPGWRISRSIPGRGWAAQPASPVSCCRRSMPLPRRRCTGPKWSRAWRKPASTSWPARQRPSPVSRKARLPAGAG